MVLFELNKFALVFNWFVEAPCVVDEKHPIYQ